MFFVCVLFFFFFCLLRVGAKRGNACFGWERNEYYEKLNNQIELSLYYGYENSFIYHKPEATSFNIKILDDLELLEFISQCRLRDKLV